MSFTHDQIKHMVNRFLAWNLPENFNPDGGITFKREYNDSPAAMELLGIDKPMKREPVGTNLFDAAQAAAMVRHILEGLPSKSETRPILRDCPFCHADGSNDEKIHFMGNLMIYNGGEYVASYTIFCTGCGVQLHDEYKDDLVNLWNGVVASDEEDEAA